MVVCLVTNGDFPKHCYSKSEVFEEPTPFHPPRAVLWECRVVVNVSDSDVVAIICYCRLYFCNKKNEKHYLFFSVTLTDLIEVPEDVCI